MQELRQSTAGQVVSFGTFVDDGDFKTPETGLTIANTDIKLRKHGATTLANKNSGGATHIATGKYYATFDATDSDTPGQLDVYIDISGALVYWKSFMVLTAEAYDAKYETTGPLLSLGILDRGTAQAATANTIQFRAAAAFGNDTILGAVVMALGSTQGYPQFGVVSDYDGATDTATLEENWSVTPSGTITYAVFAAAKAVSLSEIGVAVRDTAKAGAAAGSVGEAWVNAETDASTAANEATTAAIGVASVEAKVDIIDTTVDAVKAKTDQLVFTVANQVDANALSGGTGLDAAGVRAAVGLASANLDTQLSTIDGILDQLKDATILLDTTVASVTTQTQFILTAGQSANSIYNRRLALFIKNSDPTVRQVVDVFTYTGASRLLVTYTSPDFTVVAGDRVVLINISEMGQLNKLALESIAGAQLPNILTAVAAVPTAEENADTLLNRRQTGGATGSSGDRVKDALAPGLMKFSGLGTSTMTVLDAEDNPAFTRDITRSGSVLLPVTSSEE